MLVVVSPAKKIDMSPVEAGPLTDPRFPQKTKQLAKAAGQLSQADLKKLMGISDNLAELNKSRFATFGTQERKAAMFAFAGDTYQGLDATSLEHDEITFAQQHLRILSGLYGLLRPLDTIEPYRLEMGSRLATARGKSLYEYWGSTLSHALNNDAKETQSTHLINCASQEYFGAVDQSALTLKTITPVFMEETDKGPKIVSFYAKKARGAMARFIITHRLSDVEQILDFDTGGYTYVHERSTPEKPYFLRPQGAT